MSGTETIGYFCYNRKAIPRDYLSELYKKFEVATKYDKMSEIKFCASALIYFSVTLTTGTHTFSVIFVLRTSFKFMLKIQSSHASLFFQIYYSI